MRKAVVVLLLFAMASAALAGTEDFLARRKDKEDPDRLLRLEALANAPKKSVGLTWGLWVLSGVFSFTGGVHQLYLGNYLLFAAEFVGALYGSAWAWEYLYYGYGSYDDIGFYCMVGWLVLWIYDAFTMTGKVNAYNKKQVEIYIEENSRRGLQQRIPLYAEAF